MFQREPVMDVRDLPEYAPPQSDAHCLLLPLRILRGGGQRALASAGKLAPQSHRMLGVV
jgi:hypothetical protein